MVNVIVCLTVLFITLPGDFLKTFLSLCKFYWISLVFLFLPQNNSLIECAKKGDLSGIKFALSRGTDVNATDLVS